MPEKLRTGNGPRNSPDQREQERARTEHEQAYRRYLDEHPPDWQEFYAKFDIPEDLQPYFQGGEKLPAKVSEDLRNRFGRKLEEVALASWESDLQKRRVPEYLWPFITGRTAIPPDDAGKTIRTEINTWTKKAGNIEHLMAPITGAQGELGAYERTGAQPQDLPPYSKEFIEMMREFPTIAPLAIRRFADKLQSINFKNARTRAFAQLLGRQIEEKAFREARKKAERNRYDNALWALMSSGILAIDFPGGSRKPYIHLPEGGYQLLAQHIEAYLLLKQLRPLEKELTQVGEHQVRGTDRTELEAQKGKFESGPSFRSVRFLLARIQETRPRANVSNMKTIVEQVGDRMFVSVRELPDTLPAMQAALAGDADTLASNSAEPTKHVPDTVKEILERCGQTMLRLQNELSLAESNWQVTQKYLVDPEEAERALLEGDLGSIERDLRDILETLNGPALGVESDGTREETRAEQSGIKKAFQKRRDEFTAGGHLNEAREIGQILERRVPQIESEARKLLQDVVTHQSRVLKEINIDAVVKALKDEIEASGELGPLLEPDPESGEESQMGSLLKDFSTATTDEHKLAIVSALYDLGVLQIKK